MTEPICNIYLLQHNFYLSIKQNIFINQHFFKAIWHNKGIKILLASKISTFSKYFESFGSIYFHFKKHFIYYSTDNCQTKNSGCYNFIPLENHLLIIWRCNKYFIFLLHLICLKLIVDLHKVYKLLIKDIQIIPMIWLLKSQYAVARIKKLLYFKSKTGRKKSWQKERLKQNVKYY